MDIGALLKLREKFLPCIDIKNVMVSIDMSLPSNKERLDVWVESQDQWHCLIKTHCAHGINSCSEKDRTYAKYFSNNITSRMTCLGAMVTVNTFDGKHGYSLNLYGLEKGVNDNANERHIIIHACGYASNDHILEFGRTGFSWGNIVVSPSLCTQLIDTIKNGAFVYVHNGI